MVLIIASGVSIFLILNLFEIFGTIDLTFKTSENYTVNYPQGSGNLHVDWKLTHEREDNYISELTYITTATGDVEEIGMTYYELNVEVNYYFRRVERLNLSQPSTNYHHSFDLKYLLKDDVVDCRGYIDVQFNVNDVIQEETISFDLSVTIPTDTGARLYEIELTLIWVEVILIVGLGVMIIYIARTIKMIQRDRMLTEDDRRRDDEFFEFIKEKSEDQKD